MKDNQKTYKNLSIMGILFLMTGYLLEKILNFNVFVAMICYALSIACLLTSILKSNKQKKIDKEVKKLEKK